MVPAAVDFNIFPWVFCIFLISLWYAIVHFLSHQSGWAELAKQYRLQQNYTGGYKRFQLGRVGPIGYSGALSVGSNQQGLYLAILPPLALGSPPLLIPWNRIQSVKRTIFRFRGAVLEDMAAVQIDGHELRIPWSIINLSREWLDPAKIVE
jgi:hypothetical protein